MTTGGTTDTHRTPNVARETSDDDTDEPRTATNNYMPSAPLSKTTTTLVGQVRGPPGPKPNTESNIKLQAKFPNVDSGLDSPPSSPSPPLVTGRTTVSPAVPNPALRSSSSSTSSYTRPGHTRPKSQNLSDLPPKHPGGKKRHSYHPSSGQAPSGADQPPRKLSGEVTYADLDTKAFMIPANQVLPPIQNRQTYAEISVSRSKIV